MGFFDGDASPTHLDAHDRREMAKGEVCKETLDKLFCSAYDPEVGQWSITRIQNLGGSKPEPHLDAHDRREIAKGVACPAEGSLCSQYDPNLGSWGLVKRPEGR